MNRLWQTVLVVPLSTAARAHPPITVLVTCQGQAAVAIIDQLRAVATHRLQSKIEMTSPMTLQHVLAALAQILEMP